MKHLRKVLVLLFCVLLMTGAAAPAARAAGEQTEITDFFGPGCFSDDTANRMLSLIPRICSSFCAMEISSLLPKNAEYSVSTSIGTVRFGYSFYADGEKGTVPLDMIFASRGMYIYPGTLGNYLSGKGYPETGSALAAAGRDWTAFADENGDYGFAFDWGIDEQNSTEERYERFISVAGDIIDACRPVFDALFGNAVRTVEFPGMRFCEADFSDFRLGSFTLIGGEVVTATWRSLSITLGPADFFRTYIIPLYKMLGAGTVVPFVFSEWNAGTSGRKAAEALFAPLYAIVVKVLSDPDTCRRLIEYYHSSVSARYLPSGELSIDVSVAVGGCEMRFENKLFDSYLTFVKTMAEDELYQTVPFSIPVTLSDDGMNASVIYETLQNLTYTEPGIPAEPEEPAETGTPENAAVSIIEVIRNLFEGIIGFFRRLFG